MADVSFDIGGGASDYSTLSAAEAAQEAVRPNLVSNDERLIFNMYAFDDTTAATIAGTWTTDSTRYILITSPSSERHSGTYSTSKARMTNTAANCLTLTVNYTVVEWMQFSVSTANITCVTVNNDGCIVRNCIMRATDTNPQILLSMLNNCTIRNVLAYESGRHGFFFNGGTITCQNCTAANCVRNGFWNLGATAVTITNCLGHSNGNGSTLWDFVDDGASMTPTYCSASDASTELSSGTGNRQSQTFTFVDEANDNYALASTDAGARDLGTSLSGSFTDDCAGNTRSGTWDIGAFEYISAGRTTRNTRSAPLGVTVGMNWRM
ncbi:MAG: hypothetical protein ABT940_00440 [Alphaproteobacteria bacterium]